ncbi:MFS transporter [Pandoraea nosoerga]|uniref:Tartrate transporter n=1 Tax=Pandoraea nosoerga TaxID=2508296 RepID=A0A5E4SBT3_9BURK|nr:MFS transporter [Pandoraea nosoerga]MBN4666962.1 MFS transporter [Pandoraea nosoerga]MBN4674823.1 MFS transporter [Pandoraea nosoerga]MBN4681802.1 MFS transporter [Pandoraea nosoerga]MBN4744118.1 MFS transporter [Pandoraea nosoerga]VVD72621.1 Putative tartrate transporter [Pandoraea nosoerga]
MTALSTNAVADPAFEQRTMTKVGWRILPFLCICFLVNYIDRTNVSFAALTMNRDLGLTPTGFGWIVGAFFFGYCISEIPSNLALQKFGARRWLATIMIAWGFMTMVCALARTPAELMAARFLLGVAEGGFSPAVFIYLAQWFPSRWRAKAIATFLLGVPLAAVFGGPLSGAILSLSGVAGLKHWQWLFLLEGVPALVLGALCLRMLIDSPTKAAWLNADEKAWIESELRAERLEIESAGHMTLGQSLTDFRVIVLSLTYLTGLIGLNGVYYWMPQILKSFGLDTVTVGLVSAIPNFVSAVGMVLWARSSDRTGQRVGHVVATCLLGAAALAVSSAFSDPRVLMVGLTVALIGGFGFLATFWAVPSTFLTGRAAAGGFGLILSIGNSSGFFGPYIVGWLREETHGYGGSFLALSGFLIAAVLLSLTFVRRARALEVAPSGAS